MTSRRPRDNHERLAEIERTVRDVQADPEGSLRVVAGLRRVGVIGTDRVTFALSPEEVLKVELFPVGHRQNGRQNDAEVATWQLASGDDARLLCPVTAAGPGWLTMKRAAPYADGIQEGEVGLPPSLARPFLHLTGDIAAENFGWYEGRLVLIDYGLPTEPTAVLLHRALIDLLARGR